MRSRAVVWVKVAVHAACAGPVVWLVWFYRDGGLGAVDDPVKWVQHFTGDWALWLLLVDLAITPVRRLSGALGWLIRLRRMVGLWVFFYATLHLLSYVFLFSGYDFAAAVAGVRARHVSEAWVQLKFVWPVMVEDLKKQRFIQLGLAAWVMLLMLAVTSPLRVLRWMGGRWWGWVHRLIYLAGVVAVVHFWLQMKTGGRAPWKVTVVLAVLLLARIFWWVRKKSLKEVGSRG